MKSGIHEWTLALENEGDYDAMLGIASALAELDFGGPLGLREGTWGADLFGRRFHVNENRGDFIWELVPNQEYTFTLNLNPHGEGNGTLDAKCAGISRRLFSDLRDHLEEQNGAGGFVPAVSTRPGTTIRIVNFQKVED